MIKQAEAPTTPLLSVRGLTTSFRHSNGWRDAVRNLSFDIAAGETVALVGESGSGKSVTALSIMRLLLEGRSRTEGEILFAGQDLATLDEDAMRHVRGGELSMIFQEPMTSLNPIFTVGQQIAEAITCHSDMSLREARAEAVRLLEKVRIPHAASRYDEYPHQFSGGMRQRVMIAMALAASPRLLIADEPTTALDVTIQGQILDLIKTLQDEEGMSVLFITHDMGVVAEMADRTVVMYRGEAVEADTTDDIFHRGEHPYTRALIAAVPKLGAMKGRAWPATFPTVDLVTGLMNPERDMVATVETQRPPVLEVKNLSTRFSVRSGLFGRKSGAIHAVEDVSFSLLAGETLSIVGESGCGKSTVARSITRLVQPTSGSVRVDGMDAMALKGEGLRAMRRTVQMVFQDPFSSLNPRMSVGAAVMEPYLEHRLGSSAEARDKAAGLLGRVGLSADMMERYPHEFSGGQRQRVAIARALMLDPTIIIADEAVSALDVSIKAQVCNLLMELQDSLDLAYLFISHDMAVVERVSHRVAVMYLGEIVEIGPRAAVFENPQHAYTRRLMKAVPVPDPARRHLHRNIAVSEMKNPVRPVGFIPPKRRYIEVSPGHFVQLLEEQAALVA
jgi:peptide/nickel transport system ATP-binding protein